VLASFIGTIGASVLLIRPVLRINQGRQHTAHLPVFFIFLVGNLGGLLTPLGDPPLLLGFLNGVPFAWTLGLWPAWLFVNGIVLVVFWAWDTWAWRRETAAALNVPRSPWRLEGLVNIPLLAGVVMAVLLESVAPWPSGVAILLVVGLLSWWLTPAQLRRDNGFSWAPMAEVTILFAGIFVTMTPAIALLSRHGLEFGLTEPRHFFWLTGGLSGFLDNAPTYLTFATLAAGSDDFGRLVRNEAPGLNGPMVLEAISCGAVFMGAMTYIGNGPNFMVKSIADSAGYKTPSFFGYIGYVCLILGPVLVLFSWLFLPSR
jgi:Na+/H+ antiporter NhaD/arsenite permease-like protein